jgi:hypothetical protein
MYQKHVLVFLPDEYYYYFGCKDIIMVRAMGLIKSDDSLPRSSIIMTVKLANTREQKWAHTYVRIHTF